MAGMQGLLAIRLYIAPLCVVLLAALLTIEPGAQWCYYERQQIAQGQWWRVLTGHLVHVGLAHWLLNAAALCVVQHLVGWPLSSSNWSIYSIAICLLISACLWWLSPELQWYAGLSGLIHGQLVLGALLIWSRQVLAMSVLLAVIAVKLGLEAWQGAPQSTQELIGSPVAVQAHWYGAAAGLLCFCLEKKLKRAVFHTSP